jgi:hypothetical protein
VALASAPKSAWRWSAAWWDASTPETPARWSTRAAYGMNRALVVVVEATRAAAGRWWWATEGRSAPSRCR